MLSGKHVVLATALATLLSPAVALSQDQSLDNLAQELIRLRNDVEALHSELESKRERYRIELRSLATQKAELEASKRREELSIQQLEETLAETREVARQAGVAGETLQPALVESISALQRHIDAGIPFKPEERTASLEDLRRRLHSGAVTPQRAVNRLWSFFEDELRLTRENGIYSQVVNLNGKEVLVDVARLGTVFMYFRTRDERFGMAVETPQGWRFERVSDSEDARRIENLFDSLSKQIRTGYFTLPNPGIGGGNQ